jgi:hypothetical protein
MRGQFKYRKSNPEPRLLAANDLPFVFAELVIVAGVVASEP